MSQVAELHAEARALGCDVRREIVTYGEPYNAYDLVWRLSAWRGDELVTTAEHRDLTPAYDLILASLRALRGVPPTEGQT